MRAPISGNVLVLAAALSPGLPAQPDDPPPSAEQKVFDRFTGAWTTTYTVRKAEWTPEDKVGSAAVTFDRVLGGAAGGQLRRRRRAAQVLRRRAALPIMALLRQAAG
jgi:hypothetical protein